MKDALAPPTTIASVAACLLIAGCSASPLQEERPIGSAHVVVALEAPKPTVPTSPTSQPPSVVSDIEIGPEQRRPVYGRDPSDTSKQPGTTVEQAETTNASGKLTRESVRTTLDASSDEFERCFASFATMSAKMLVGPSGDVINAAVLASQPDDPDLRDCISQALLNVRFGRTGGNVVPLTFQLAIHGNGR